MDIDPNSEQMEVIYNATVPLCESIEFVLDGNAQKPKGCEVNYMKNSTIRRDPWSSKKYPGSK